MPSAFGKRERFDVNASHIFPQVVLAVITLVVVGAGDGDARAGAGCETGLPFCSVVITTLLEWSLIPSYWSRSSEGEPWTGSVPFKCVLPPLPAQKLLPQSRRVLK